MKHFFGWIALFLVSGVAHARMIWVVGGRASSNLAGQSVRWNGNVIFHNFTAADGVVKVVHVSNSTGTPAFPPLTVPPDTSTSSFNAAAPAPAWIAQYEISDEITPESRLEIYPLAQYGPGGDFLLPPLANVSMPVFTRLFQPGEPQRHLGTDQGGMPVRVNVGIYNAGTQTATATITLVERVSGLPVPVPVPENASRRRPDEVSCKREISAIVTVPPDTYQQFPLGDLEPCYNPYSFETFTTVTVDQPSLSVVSTLSNNALVSASVSAPR